MGLLAVTLPCWTREQVAARILGGDTLFILHNKVIRVPQSWLTVHPGGALSILHFTGRDATDEVQAFHSDSTLQRIGGYAVATIGLDTAGWIPLLPPVQAGWIRKVGDDGRLYWEKEATELYASDDAEHRPSSQILLLPKPDCTSTSPPAGPTMLTLEPAPTSLSPDQQFQHSVAYKELHQRIKDAGLYQCHYITGYGPEVMRYILLAMGSYILYQKQWFWTSAVFLGMLWHQLVFVVHDLGHIGVTHDWTTDRLLATLVGSCCGGLSASWWVANHNIHHVVTNHPSHDPDIQYLPFFAITPVFFKSLWSTYYKRPFIFDASARYLIAIQHRLFYIIMAFARFNLYRLSYEYLWKTRNDPPKARGGKWLRCVEILGIVFWAVWYGKAIVGCKTWRQSLGYLLISNIVPSPLHVQFVVSHFSRSTADLGPTESFVHRQLRTTTDVICAPSVAFLHGGLHLQVTHHLFPRLPRHNLMEASLLVKKFCEERELEYAEFGFWQGNNEVRGTLKAVADQVKIIKMVADREIEHMMGRQRE